MDDFEPSSLDSFFDDDAPTGSFLVDAPPEATTGPSVVGVVPTSAGARKIPDASPPDIYQHPAHRVMEREVKEHINTAGRAKLRVVIGILSVFALLACLIGKGDSEPQPLLTTNARDQFPLPLSGFAEDHGANIVREPQKGQVSTSSQKASFVPAITNIDETYQLRASTTTAKASTKPTAGNVSSVGAGLINRAIVTTGRGTNGRNDDVKMITTVPGKPIASEVAEERSAPSNGACTPCQSKALHHPKMMLLRPDLLNGARIWVWSENCTVSDSIQQQKAWMTTVNQLLEESLRLTGPSFRNLANSRPGLLDLGVKLGWFSLVWATRGGRALGVEAFQENMVAVKRTIKENAEHLEQPLNISIVSASISACIGAMVCQQSADIEPGPRLPASINSALDSGVATPTTVDAIISDSLDRSGVQTFLTMRLELGGWEAHAIRGAQTLLDDISRKPCMIIVDQGRDATPLNRRQLCDEIVAVGYSLFDAGGDDPDFNPITPPQCQLGTLPRQLVALWTGCRSRPECMVLASWKGGDRPRLLQSVRNRVTLVEEPGPLRPLCCDVDGPGL